jgi:transglutaminase-like putative cysteine protease
MRYTIRHVTRFAYEAPISESVMEVRMQPRSDGVQRCLHFGVTTNPATRVLMYQDHSGNMVHHFDIPGIHEHLTITAESMVESEEPDELPHRLGPRAWAELDQLAASGELWEYLAPSAFAKRTPLLDALAKELRLQRGNDPLVTARRLMGDMYTRFDYRPRTTRVDSPIDDAIAQKAGVCQDFSHIFIALARALGIPARYVSGYLYHDADRAERSADGATHAWVELYLPDVGWTGIDPTNNLLTGARHIRVAVGRDYADVPPTRGVYKGEAEVKSELLVGVTVGSVLKVGSSKSPLTADDVPFTPWMSRVANAPVAASTAAQRLQQQQQQQQ